MAYIGQMEKGGDDYYVDPLIQDRHRLIFVRFDAINPASYSTPVYFPNDDVLKNKVITGIDVWRTQKVISNPQIQTDAGYIGEYFDDTLLKYFTITLVGKSGEILVQDMPLQILNNGNNGDFGKTRRFSMMVDLSRSFVRNFGLAGLKDISIIPIMFSYRNLSV